LVLNDVRREFCLGISRFDFIAYSYNGIIPIMGINIFVSIGFVQRMDLVSTSCNP